MLEFVTSCFLLLVVFAGMINIGLLLKDRLTVASAAREAGRVAAIWDIETGRQKGFEILASGGVRTENAEVNITQTGNIITAQVSYDAPVCLPLLAGLMGGDVWENTITIGSTKYFKKEPPD